jgi:hypothetical protein
LQKGENVNATKTLLVMPIFVSACVATVQTHRHGGQLEHGIEYYLPKTLLAVKITYTVIDRVQYENGIPATPTRSVVIEKPVQVAPCVHADHRHPLVLAPEAGADAAMLETKFGFKLADSGVLLDASATFKDHTADFVQQMVGTAIATAKLVAAAAAGPDDKLKLQKRISEVIGQLGKQDTETATKRLAAVQTLQKELESLLAIQDSLARANRLETTKTDVLLETLLDPEEFVASPDGYAAEIVPKGVFKSADGRNVIGGALLPTVRVRLKVTKTDFERAFDLPIRDGVVPGIVYRAARPVEMRVEVVHGGATAEVMRAVVPVLQFGLASVAVLRSKRAGDREVHATLSSATGGLAEYKVDSTASADQFLQKIRDSIEGVQKTMNDLRFNIVADAAKARMARDQAKSDQQAASETDAVKRETELVKAKIALEQARSDLTKLQAGSAQ